MGNQYTCFQCGSPDHFKWYCTKYRCYFCHKLSPGHSQKQCPENQLIYDDHYDDVIENESCINTESFPFLIFLTPFFLPSYFDPTTLFFSSLMATTHFTEHFLLCPGQTSSIF